MSKALFFLAVLILASFVGLIIQRVHIERLEARTWDLERLLNGHFYEAGKMMDSWLKDGTYEITDEEVHWVLTNAVLPRRALTANPFDQLHPQFMTNGHAEMIRLIQNSIVSNAFLRLLEANHEPKP